MRKPPEAVPNSYARQWRRYRILRNSLVLLTVGWLPASRPIDDLSLKLFHEHGPAFLIENAWAFSCVFIGVYLMGWRCPRCGQQFFQRSWRNRWPFAKQCFHCGLSKFAEPS